MSENYAHLYLTFTSNCRRIYYFENCPTHLYILCYDLKIGHLTYYISTPFSLYIHMHSLSLSETSFTSYKNPFNFHPASWKLQFKRRGNLQHKDLHPPHTHTHKPSLPDNISLLTFTSLICGGLVSNFSLFRKPHRT